MHGSELWGPLGLAGLTNELSPVPATDANCDHHHHHHHHWHHHHHHHHRHHSSFGVARYAMCFTHELSQVLGGSSQPSSSYTVISKVCWFISIFLPIVCLFVHLSHSFQTPRMKPIAENGQWASLLYLKEENFENIYWGANIASMQSCFDIGVLVYLYGQVRSNCHGLLLWLWSRSVLLNV